MTEPTHHSVAWAGSPNQSAAESGADRLVSQADPEQRNRRVGEIDRQGDRQMGRDPGIFRASRAGGDDDPARSLFHDFGDARLVVSEYGDVDGKALERLHEVAHAMVDEWAQTKKAPRHAAWLHEREFGEDS